MFCLEDVEEQQQQLDIQKREMKTLVIALEVLVTYSIEEMDEYNTILPIDIGRSTYDVYVKLRGLSLKGLAKSFEVILFTNTIPQFANPIMDLIDPDQHASYRLFRDNCVQVGDSVLMNLGTLNRNPEGIIALQCAPNTYHQLPDNVLEVEELNLLCHFFSILLDVV
jgi:RNA polymerase II subunit A small phosphatase-like protein